MTAPVNATLQRSCLDCHSNQTVWPWYSYVAPLSWLIERDVDRGRTQMNFSEWQLYTSKRKKELLANIATAVENGEMPPAQYALVHRRAKLSETETRAVYAWARAERRRLKAESDISLSPANDPAGTTSHP